MPSRDSIVQVVDPVIRETAHPKIQYEQVGFAYLTHFDELSGTAGIDLLRE
jgi:hypothetical protein